MADETTFLVQVKRTNNTYTKGVVVKDTPNEALQGYYAYLGAYGFGHDPDTDYVYCQVVKSDGVILEWKKDDRRPEPVPPEPEPEPNLALEE